MGLAWIESFAAVSFRLVEVAKSFVRNADAGVVPWQIPPAPLAKGEHGRSSSFKAWEPDFR